MEAYEPPVVPPGVDPLYIAITRFNRRDYAATIALCTQLLEAQPFDQAAWYLKTRALTMAVWVDDVEVEEEGVADVLLDDNATAAMPRPGTSLARPMTGVAAGGLNAGVRPTSSSGRPTTGFARAGTGTGRPGTQSRGGTAGGGVAAAMMGARPGTSRPMTSFGRLVRLGTASLAAASVNGAGGGGAFILVDKLDLRKYAARPALARALFEYIMYHDHNPKKALELAALATSAADFGDWWWKERLGKCYLQLGLLRDAEKQLRSAILAQPTVLANLELARVYLKLDQPNAALEARTCDVLNEGTKAIVHYKRALQLDATHVEALACLAAHHFYTDQPELALRFFRRLLQLGVSSPALWNNLGLSCFFSAQYDLCLAAFERALALASDAESGDVWYNVGQVAIGIGDLGLAYQAFKIAISVDSNHVESYANLGVLELRKGNIDAARSNFQTVQEMAPYMFEPFFNGALLAFKLGDFQESYELVMKAILAFPEHTDSHELLRQLRQQFSSL
mmetsp:Transcript_14346/g.34067  ORF Transcript_14346/g.34067 Transcript_14346/m.34067 type:complete len:509 (-) Transcript_14346:210-1736(-)